MARGNAKFEVTGGEKEEQLMKSAGYGLVACRGSGTGGELGIDEVVVSWAVEHVNDWLLIGREVCEQDANQGEEKSGEEIGGSP
mmetsp:Transcript_37245/g.117225  ORF Transcript_37245/g.117225 Transcript_37245/m.117225 type:complete len:84 (-) Transcript_37245:1013-1264(-)